MVKQWISVTVSADTEQEAREIARKRCDDGKGLDIIDERTDFVGFRIDDVIDL